MCGWRIFKEPRFANDNGLDKRDALNEHPPSTETSSRKSSVISKQTIVKPKFFSSPYKRRTSYLKQEGDKVQPTFISGYENGVPVYSTIKVALEEVVKRIEDAISAEEMEERLRARQASIIALSE